MAANTVRIGDIFQDLSFTPYQYRICIFCFLVCFLDGFDLTIIGVTLPKIADYLGSSHDALGFALGAGQFGPLVGAVFLGMAADRFGRKWMLCVSAVIFGVFTLLTPTISDAGQLGIFRFLTGIGLGGAIPNGLAIASEYAPAKSRSFIVAAMYAGMPAGAMTGGLIAAYIIPNYGWQHMFYIGGWAPIVLGCVVAIWLPESLEFLASRNRAGDQDRIRDIVGHISPDVSHGESTMFINTVVAGPGVPVKRLFTEGRGVTTLFLWVVCSRRSLSSLGVEYLVAYPAEKQRCNSAAIQFRLFIALLWGDDFIVFCRLDHGSPQPVPGAADWVRSRSIEPDCFWCRGRERFFYSHRNSFRGLWNFH